MSYLITVDSFRQEHPNCHLVQVEFDSRPEIDAQFEPTRIHLLRWHAKFPLAIKVGDFVTEDHEREGHADFVFANEDDARRFREAFNATLLPPAPGFASHAVFIHEWERHLEIERAHDEWFQGLVKETARTGQWPEFIRAPEDR